MGTTRFITRNYLNDSNALIKSVTFEDPAQPATNLLSPDRYTVYGTGAGTGDLYITVDIGAGPKPVTLVGLLGFKRTGSGLFPNGFWFFRSNTYPVPLEGGTFVSLSGSIPPDLYLAIPQENFRYWTYLFTFVPEPFTLGNPLLATVNHDLGIIASPGMTRRKVYTRTRTRSVGGRPFISERGLPHFELSIPFAGIQESMRSVLAQVADSPLILMLNAWDQLHQWVLLNDEFSDVHTFNPPDRFSASLELEQLP